MPELVVTDRGGETRTVSGNTGATVMEALRDNGFDDIVALCGGVCSCATCHVHIDPAFADLVGPPGEDENDLLDTSPHRDERSRLSCQIRFEDRLDGLRLTIAQED